MGETSVRSVDSAFRTPHSALLVTFPLPSSAHRPDVDVAAQLRAAGFVRAQLDGAMVRLDQADAEERVRQAGQVLASWYCRRNTRMYCL